MDTEKESEKWHTGIFRGIKVGIKTHDPRKLKKALKARNYSLSRKGALAYYHNDEHYHDIPAGIIYLVITSFEAGVLFMGLKAFGL